ncbi:MAG: GAF domain-containing protein [Anaerolineae bacterium]|nr:GAF domain-containing protein [Anaerolineae bacterium]
MSVWTWIKKLLAPPVFEGDEEKTRNAAILNTLLWIMLGAIIVASYFQIRDSATLGARTAAAAMIYAVFVPALGGLIWMSHRGHVRQAGGLLATLVWAITTVAIIIFGGIRSTVSPAFFVSIFIAGLLMGWRAAMGFCFLTTVSLFVVLMLELSGVQFGPYMIPLYPSTGVGFDDFFMLVGIVVATTTIVGLSRRSIVSALQRAQSHEGALAEVNRELESRSRELQIRTLELGRRSMQLQIAAEIARDVTAMREVSELLGRAVEQLKDRLGFYHVAILLVDEQEKFAVLRAATGEPGRRMLEQNYRVDVEEEGPISYVVSSGYHRILLDVGDDAVSFENPLLPDSRSEIVLPLRVGRHIIGALEIHSQQEAAFTADDAAVLQSMADQLAVAIENTRLLEEMQQALRELELASGRYTQESWRLSVARGRRGIGYRYRRLGIERVTDLSPEARHAWLDGAPVVASEQSAGGGREDGGAVAVPIKLRDQVVGVLDLNFEDQSVSPETLTLVEEIAGRLALALENARLLDETRQRAQRDRLIADITAQVRASMDIDRILKTAVQGIGAALGSDRAFIQLETGQQQAAPAEGKQSPEEVDDQAS